MILFISSTSKSNSLPRHHRINRHQTADIASSLWKHLRQLPRLQIQFRISRSFRPPNLANLGSKIRFWIRRKEHTLVVTHYTKQMSACNQESKQQRRLRTIHFRSWKETKTAFFVRQFLRLSVLLYIELAIYFLIGRKRTVNFGNQRLWRHTCRLYNNHVKVRGNHVMYDRGAWFPRVIMSSLRALCGLPSVKKQNNVQVCQRLRLITDTLIILDIAQTESNNCFIIHWTKKEMSRQYTFTCKPGRCLLLHRRQAITKREAFGFGW